MLPENEPYGVSPLDCIEGMHAMPPACVDLAVTSVPFPSLYAYTDEQCDVGNSEDEPEMRLHLGFFFAGLRRVLKPGRVAVIHAMQIPRMARSGGRGLIDFRGLLIRLGERAGLVYDYDWSVRKNPQAQAIRTKSRQLQFAGLESDRAKSRGALPDCLIKFLATGENAVAVDSPGDVPRNDWIELAEHCWRDIRETDTLNYRRAKGEQDTKHICPLQLSVIDRLVRLYTNPGELVFDPFTGVGSTGYVALGGPSPVTKKRITTGPRRFYGFEIKEEYRREALANLGRAVRLSREEDRGLFDDLPEPETAA